MSRQFHALGSNSSNRFVSGFCTSKCFDSFIVITFATFYQLFEKHHSIIPLGLILSKIHFAANPFSCEISSLSRVLCLRIKTDYEKEWFLLGGKILPRILLHGQLYGFRTCSDENGRSEKRKKLLSAMPNCKSKRRKGCKKKKNKDLPQSQVL